jgi:hypothetical protein
MVEVTYHCPHCGALTSLDRRARMADKSVTEGPLSGWEYAATTEAFEEADGVEMVCLGNADDDPDAGCGRTYYLSFVKFADGEEMDPSNEWLEDEPRFDFLR